MMQDKNASRLIAPGIVTPQVLNEESLQAEDAVNSSCTAGAVYRCTRVHQLGQSYQML